MAEKKRILERDIPKIAVIWAMTVTCMGTRMLASAKGIGVKPTPKDAATYFFAQLAASSAFLCISACWALLKAFLVCSGMVSRLRATRSFKP